MNLKELRIISGLKSIKIANELGISRQQLRNLEKGKYVICDKKTKILSTLYRTTEVDITNSWKQARKGGKQNDKKRY
jgi:transcriptional regulator with XRE-family HTH domain